MKSFRHRAGLFRLRIFHQIGCIQVLNRKFFDAKAGNRVDDQSDDSIDDGSDFPAGSTASQTGNEVHCSCLDDHGCSEGKHIADGPQLYPLRGVFCDQCGEGCVGNVIDRIKNSMG